MNLRRFHWTIKQRLFALTLCGLMFVAAVSLVGYWAIKSVQKTAVQVGASGRAMLNHQQAAVFNDLTQADLASILKSKGDEQQSIVQNLALHSKMLAEHLATARTLVSDPALQLTLEEERQLLDAYMKENAKLGEMIARNSEGAAQQQDICLNLYGKLQQELVYSGDEVEKGANAAETEAAHEAVRATRVMFAMCGLSLLLLLTVATGITVSISRPLDSLAKTFKAMTEANDLTSRVDQERRDEIGQLGKCLNSFLDKMHHMLTQIARTAENVARASNEMNATSHRIRKTSEETSGRAKLVSDATARVSENLQTVATGSEEMGASIQEIAKSATEAANVATSAVKVAESSSHAVSRLGASSSQIGQVIEVITRIAQQTNLLALNATIEAARAGEAGKGFAVVAQEVKELAKQTAKATEDISQKIASIQSDTKAAVDAITSVSGVINQVNDISGVIATAVEEQNATTNEMSRNVTEAANGSSEISSNISGVAEAAHGTTADAAETQKASQQLVELSAELRDLVGKFKINAAGAGPDAIVGPPTSNSQARHATA
jgi:methyl-accepting chemotaxis protein